MTGVTGFSGFSGVTGVTGFSGFSGVTGFSGFSGVTGFPGAGGCSGAGGCAWLPDPFAQPLPKAGLPTPVVLTVLPQALTGTETGACTLLPEATPGESLVRPTAAAPPPDPVPAPPPVLAHVLPNAGLMAPIVFSELPHAFTGTCSGTWTEFPDSTPGEWWAPPTAVESACA
ncbi:hypothetical protein GUY61_33110 [Streptomyces sp. GC420]|nr:hypothetical protein [Streptomyces sp. GC420]